MLIGTGKNKRIAEKIPHLECPVCKTQGSILMEGYQEFLILGLPVFPTSKKVEITCTSCKKYFPPSAVTREMWNGVQYIKSKTKPTVFMYLLPVVLGALLLFGWMSSGKKASRNVAKIEQIKAGDVYTMEVVDFRYVNMKVLGIEDSEVIFQESGREPVKISKISSDDFFYGDTIVMTKKELLNLNKQHKIKDIYRPE